GAWSTRSAQSQVASSCSIQTAGTPTSSAEPTAPRSTPPIAWRSPLGSSAAAKEFTANFGTWSVAATEMTITLRFVGSLDPNNEGTQATYALALSGNGMTFSITLPGQRLEVVKYRRAN